MFYDALLVFCVAGIVGVLVDLDHVIKFYLLSKWGWRFLHIPILVVVGFVLCGTLAYLGGLFLGMVLK